ncbi:UNVERIFIED_CONTAM: hypothetical protein FKN15_030877, partial [Acipenser sinensis]
SVKIAPGAVVCVESEIRGDVTIGPRTVVHPKARILAEAGPIVIGEGNLIEEQALLINCSREKEKRIVGKKKAPIGAQHQERMSTDSGVNPEDPGKKWGNLAASSGGQGCYAK